MTLILEESQKLENDQTGKEKIQTFKFRNIVFIIFYLLLLQIYFLDFFIFKSPFVDVEIMFQPNYSPKFFFGILTTDPDKKRREIIYNEWVKVAIEHGHEAFFIADTQLTDVPFITKNRSLYHGRLQYNGNIDRAVKRVTAAQYFIEHSSLSFLWIMTDDVFTQVNSIDRFPELLNSLYPTGSDKILGDCESYQRSTNTWLQGGIGYIFTRVAAAKFSMLGEKWIHEVFREDDLEFAKYLKYIRKLPPDCAAPFIPGHNFHTLVTTDISEIAISQCPNNTYLNHCGMGVNSIDLIFAMHSSSHEDSRLQWNNLQKLKETGEKIFFYNNFATFYICHKNY